MKKLLFIAHLLVACQPGGERGDSSARSATPASGPTATGSTWASTAEVGAATASASASSTTTASPLPVTPPASDGMMRIPAGIFLMGAPADRGNPEECPAHEAIVAAFDFDTTEETTEAYHACVTAGACTQSHVGRQFCNEGVSDHGRHPINCIDLQQAAAYCAFAKKRLPTEREWEYAASGGSEQRRFSMAEGDPTEKTACYHHPFGSCEVGLFAPGAFGLRDVTGNVWEWTQTEFGTYPSKGKLDAIRSGHQYVYRGGSWSRRFPKWMRNTLRNRYRVDEWSASIGIRCARSVEPLGCPEDTAVRDGECVRIRGTTLCEGGQRFDDEKKRCVLDALMPPHLSPMGQGRAANTTAPGARTGPTESESRASPCCAKTRTPEHDADCRKNWPKTSAAYRFDGGNSFPDRLPIIKGGGCSPRDMGHTWTSACCPG